MKSIEILTNRLASLRDSYQHYTMVDKDKYKAFWIKNDIEEVEILLNELSELKRLKDLEKELGCPLKVVFKALKDGIIYETEKENKYVLIPNLIFAQFLNEDVDDYHFINYDLPNLENNLIVKLSDYQKTWWLKGEKYNG